MHDYENALNETRGHQNRKYRDYFVRQIIREITNKLSWHLYVEPDEEISVVKLHNYRQVKAKSRRQKHARTEV